MSGNNIQTGSTESNAKTDENNSNVEEEKFNIVQDESMDCNVSQRSSELDCVSESEKNNLVKRKHEVPPLLVSNFPENFSSQEIQSYLENLCGPIEIRGLKIVNGTRTVEAIFSSTLDRAVNKKQINAQTLNKVKLRAESPDYELDSLDTESDNEGPQAKRKKEEEDEAWGLDCDVWRTDPKGWYGVKPKYLATLGINDQLQPWVLVLNFRCGREELKEVMELAGDVVVCTVHCPSTKRYANVKYRHPLEALQAVSMLNGQMLHGKPLTVKISNMIGVKLPKGLNNVGPGLAKYGRPLRDVVRHYEWFIKGKDNALNSNIFRTPQEQSTNDEEEYVDNIVNERKAREALETLVSLVDEGMKVKDLLLTLKSIKVNKNQSIEDLIKELSDASDEESYHKDISPPGTDTSRIQRELKKENVRSGSVSSKASDTLPNKELINSMKETRPVTSCHSSHQISTISSNRPLDPRLTKPINQTRSVTPTYESGFGPRDIGTGPLGQMSGPSSVGRGSVIGPGGSMPGPIRPIMSGMPMRGPMSGPMTGPRPGFMPGPMSTPVQGPIRGPMPGPMSGPVRGPIPGPMSGPIPGPMSGPSSGPNAPMSMSGHVRSGPAGPMSGSMPGPNFSMPGPNNHPPFGPNLHPSPGPEATLQFSNLPLSTTFALLSDKLSQIGQLVSIQFTTPGCVVVKFAHRAHAERCIQQFDQSRLEGNVISVKFV